MLICQLVVRNEILNPDKELASEKASGSQCWRLGPWGGDGSLPRASSQPPPSKLKVQVNGSPQCCQSSSGPSKLASPSLLCREFVSQPYAASGQVA